MKPGDILLFKAEKEPLSRLIAWGTNSKYAHVVVCVSPEMNLAIEAMTRGGVRARDIRQIKEQYDVYRVKAGYDLNGVMSYLVSKLNSNYDIWGVLFLGLLKFLAKIGLPLKNIANMWQKDRDYFCSELCYEAFHVGGGLDIVPNVPEADVTSPGDIARSEILEYVSHTSHTSSIDDKKVALVTGMYIFKILIVGIWNIMRNVWKFLNRSIIVAALSIWGLTALYNHFNMVDTLNKTSLWLPYAYRYPYMGATGEKDDRKRPILEDVPIEISGKYKDRFWFQISNLNIRSLRDVSLTLVFPSGVNVTDLDNKWTRYQPNEQYSYLFPVSIHNGMAQETTALDLEFSEKGSYLIKYYISGEDMQRKDKNFEIIVK